MLLSQFSNLLSDWRSVFCQERTFERACQVGLGLLAGLGRRTITRSICFRGKEHEDWSADYKLFSRSPWEAEQLFTPIFKQAMAEYYPEGPVAVGFDDTALRRCGKKIPNAFRQRDPMSPPFHVNLLYGQRFMQASLLLPLYEQEESSSPRALPVRFQEAPAVKKPRRNAKPEQWQEYRRLKKEKNLSTYFVQSVQSVRKQLDQHGWEQRLLLAVGDGSFCNKRTFTAAYERTVVLARCRKDLSLKDPSTKRKFSPCDVFKDSAIAWQEARIFYAGAYRTIQYKECLKLWWPRLGPARLVRLLVIKPTPYQTSKNSPKQFREEAYLLSTDNDLPATLLLQKYFDRWEIEVNHRDEKSILGVGQAQVWAPLSTPRVPEFIVAMYSLLLLAALQCYGPKRTEVYRILPRWRGNAKRPSCLDLVTLLRRQLEATRGNLKGFTDHATMVETAAA